jgi:GntR family transcriptional regulator
VTTTAGRAGGVAAGSRAEHARRVADVLRQQITGGRFGHGLLPDERALGTELAASRNVIREALGLLRSEGLITRRQGVGTIVVMPKYGHGLDRLAGLAEALTGYGPVTNEVRAARTIANPPAAVAERLELEPGTDVVYIERLRRLGGLPLSLDTTYLAPDIGADLLGHDLAGRDLFALIEETTGRRLGQAEVSVHAVNAGPDTAALLEIEPGAAVFAIERLTRLADGRPVDAESVHIRADRLMLQATLHRPAPD